jgi:hypothetical protein
MAEDPGTDLSVRADDADKAGNGRQAIELERAALGYHYLAGPAETIAASHDCLGNYLARNAADFQRALAHHLAAALLLSVAGSQDARHSLISVARDLAGLTRGAVVPGTMTELSAAVAEVPGVQLDRLLGRLPGDEAAAGATLDELLDQARRWADPDTPLPRHFASWDPVIAGIIAARDGDEQARAAVDEHLAERMDSADWGRLAGVLSAMLAGSTGLPGDLDKIDTAVAGRALAALRGEAEVPRQLWPAIPFTPLIGRMVSAAWGDQDTAGQLTPALLRMAADSELGSLGRALLRILDGERAPALARNLGPVQAAVVITILFHLPPASQP